MQCSNPHMKSYSDRLRTFTNCWSHRLRATPDDFASAGLFYLGQRVRTKCYFCNGGLQNWEYADDPWVEHAKYYPSCHHVISCKGQDFVDRVHRSTNTLTQPIPTLTQPIPSPNNVMASADNVPTISNTQVTPTIRPGSRLSDFNLVMQSRAVETVLKFGFEEAVVKRNVERILKTQKEITNSEQLMQICFEEEDDPSEEVADYPGCSSMSNEDSVASCIGVQENFTEDACAPPKDLSASKLSEDELENLKTIATCRVCLVNIRACVFQPCKHLCCCYSCSASLKKCPICRKNITSILGI